MNTRFLVTVLAISLPCLGLSVSAQTASKHVVTQRVVMITLLDASTNSSVSGMEIKTDTPTVKAGRVTLQAINQSKELVHEVLVVAAPQSAAQLPYDAKHDEVIERRIHSLGEIADLKPGATGKLTVNLRPGTYLLFCNQPGHYKAGMSTMLTVER